MFPRISGKSRCVVACLLLLHGTARAQAGAPVDTLNLSLKKTEEIFLSKNLQLLAQHYNVEAGKALVQQAKLWDNPELNTDQNVYSNKRFFEHGRDEATGNPVGQYFIQVQQLIRTAGKRGKLIKMAQTSADIDQWQFSDVLRNLKQQLRVDFYTIHQLLLTREVYGQEQRQLDKLLTGMKGQLEAGNIARKDYLRIQALEISLQQDAMDNAKKLNDVQAEMRTLLQITDGSFIRPDIAGKDIPTVTALNMEELVDAAKNNNAAYRLQQLQLQYQARNLSYQKALAVPDVTVAPSYDHNSNYTPHYVGIGINLPLPVFNRNQGNIKNAAYQVKQQEATLQSAETELRNAIGSAYAKYLAARQMVTGKQESFFADYSQLYYNVVESYKQRQLSLVEFIDYFQAYKDIREKQLELELSLQQAKEEVNFLAGQDIIQ